MNNNTEIVLNVIDNTQHMYSKLFNATTQYLSGETPSRDVIVIYSENKTRLSAPFKNQILSEINRERRKYVMPAISPSQVQWDKILSHYFEYAKEQIDSIN